ncbi:transcriptional-regulating factor 1-like [Cheilinus undulatus]|uniref:transcriptional-regulating factor 1-like n=1 Tax=Cheilinus undulatus TaxID=241271 RepID=UPI001BD6DA1D|nr:transcriptional-regulating factor 1-like [Cheilinus undulatus]
MKALKLENMSKALNSRLLCSVCKREFRSLPALNGHMRSHSSFRAPSGIDKVGDSSPLDSPSVSMVIPVSVPVQSDRGDSRCSPARGGAVLYHSLMHHKKEDADGNDGAGHYIPPPMLCPIRAGPGLYCSLTTRRQQRAQTVALQNECSGPSDVVTMETASTPRRTVKTTIQPQINVGRSFQAEIPPLQRLQNVHSDSHDALLLWMPIKELELPVNQRRVNALLMMACSSVMPGGGACQETALHVLSECRGDFLMTLESLLSTPKTPNKLTAQKIPGVCWSPSERRLLVKSLRLHDKDFRKIQKTVQTKSLSQCIEFYYRWKKKMNLSARTPAGLTVTLPNTKKSRPSRSSSYYLWSEILKIP